MNAIHWYGKARRTIKVVGKGKNFKYQLYQKNINISKTNTRELKVKGKFKELREIKAVCGGLFRIDILMLKIIHLSYFGERIEKAILEVQATTLPKKLKKKPLANKWAQMINKTLYFCK